MLDVPVLFLIFNRPDVTEQVFLRIREARPRFLYVAADGPRAHRLGEAEKCHAARKVLERVDWNCSVYTLFRDQNLGCKVAVSSGIDWFFNSVEEGIILEDDTLPHPSFFSYCRDLLDRYRNDSRIGMISGDNFYPGWNRAPQSYYFSCYTHIWGWASWRRAWKYYDVAMSLWPSVREQGFLSDFHRNPIVAQYWTTIFEEVYQGRIDTWDYQLTLAHWLHSLEVILPRSNLVSNIGFGPEATHTTAKSDVANLPVYSLASPLTHPIHFIRDAVVEEYSEKFIFRIPGLAEEVISDKQSEERNNEVIEQQINSLIDKALVHLRKEEGGAALECIIEAKRHRLPVPSLDYVRALCFVQLEQLVDAQEALKEELRYFPDNVSAKELLTEIQDQLPLEPSLTFNNDEFQDLLQAVRPYTMLSTERLFSLYTLAKETCEQNRGGNFIECGVAAGGSSALLAFIIARYTKQPRWLYAIDSFEGMPPPTHHDTHQGKMAESTGWGSGTCSASENSLLEICAKLGVDDVVKPIKGRFEEVLPKVRDRLGMIALLHLDGDWYESTRAILYNLYDRTVNDALFQVDDYGYWEGCRKALHEFEQERNLSFQLTKIDGTGVWFKKPDQFPLNPILPLGLRDAFFATDPVRFGVVSQMSLNERFQLFYTLHHLLPRRSSPLRFVEIGSFSGASLLQTYMTLLHNSTSPVHGYAVEPEGRPQFYQVLQHLSSNVTHLRSFSHPASLELKRVFQQDNNYPEFILVDGDHTYEGVAQDIVDYYPLLAEGGIMLFHDFLPPLNDENKESIMFHHENNEPGIRKACEELMERQFHCEVINVPLLYPTDPTQTQAHLPIIPQVYSTIRVYRKRLS